MNIMYLATVRGDAIRRARQIDKMAASAIDRHLLFDSAANAALHMNSQAERFWVHTFYNKADAVHYLRVSNEIDDPRPLLFGTVQAVEVRNAQEP